jgi:hypothetical protein
MSFFSRALKAVSLSVALVGAPALISGTPALITAAQAEALSVDDQAAVQIRVDAFNLAFRASDFSEVMNAMPPRMKEFIAEQAQITVEELVAAMIQQTEAAMAQITIDSFEMKIDEATYSQTSENRPYALIPTNTLMSNDQVGKIEGKTHTLAMKDEGGWYLLRIEDPSQVQLLTAVYPDFEGIDFPSGSVQVVQ